MSANAQQRQTQRQEWGQCVRDNWQGQRQEFWNEFKDDFGEPGWRFEYPGIANGYFNYNHPYANGWWTWCAAATMTSWLTGWGEPVYSDYGSGGDVYYEGDTVYVNDQPAGTAEEYAQQSQELAQAGAEQLAQPVPEGQPEMEWMPLGVFALSTSSEESAPTRQMQLAVNKDGLISGTLFNSQTNQTQPIQGSVEKATQRACWYAGDKTDVVAETAIYNLTKDQAPILVHFGTDRTEEYLLVRLDPPPEASTGAAGAGTGG